MWPFPVSVVLELGVVLTTERKGRKRERVTLGEVAEFRTQASS